ncbi:hypothetical protein [uncultured Aeromicrobium sp.]|uniref:hypothetical protein n=1 Tax=uncultured Aeromicrobium sp. TaxID=337820 RepID=UPI0025D88C9E|nr:hypothetical protein [uncultured Aeromicrobium sp.]
MTGKPPLKFGKNARWGDATCMFGVDAPACDRPATTHILWFPELHTSATCDEHLAWLDTRECPEYETHPHGGDCGMPGSLWHHPYEDEEHGYCVFPAPDDASFLAEEPVMTGATP